MYRYIYHLYAIATVVYCDLRVCMLQHPLVAYDAYDNNQVLLYCSVAHMYTHTSIIQD